MFYDLDLLPFSIGLWIICVFFGVLGVHAQTIVIVWIHPSNAHAIVITWIMSYIISFAF
jgi:hypothetical protein